MKKQCSKCKIIQSISQFNKDKYTKDKHSYICKLCNKIVCNINYLKDKTKRIRQAILYNKIHKDKHNKAVKLYHQKNPNVQRNASSRYKQRHPEIHRRQQRNRRALKLKVKEFYTSADETFTYNLFNHKCANCKSSKHLTIDHHYPLSKGNALTRLNAVLLCNHCNSSKGNKLPEDFYSPKKLKRITLLLKTKHPPNNDGCFVWIPYISPISFHHSNLQLLHSS